MNIMAHDCLVLDHPSQAGQVAGQDLLRMDSECFSRLTYRQGENRECGEQKKKKKSSKICGSGFLFDCQRRQREERGSAILEGEKRKPVSKRYKVSVLIKSESGRRTQKTETEREKG